MNVDVKTLLGYAVLFSQALDEMKHDTDDRWVAFKPELAQFVADQNVKWWTLYENPAHLRAAMVVTLFSSEQLSGFIASASGRDDITRATLALTENCHALEASFEVDTGTVFDGTAVTPEHKQAAQERLGLWFVALAANLYNYLAVMVYGKSLCQLVKDAREGDDQALVQAVQVDRTVLNLPYFQQRLARAQLEGDTKFLDPLAYRLKNPLLRSKLKHPKLRIAFAILQDEGLLDRYTHEELLSLCQETGLYAGDDVDTFRKTLATYRREQRK